jgi:hypothetical protein
LVSVLKYKIGLKHINCMLYEYFTEATTQSVQLAIDECEEWVWDTLDSTKDCDFEYIKDGNKEFLIFNTNDFFANAKALEKIRKTTGMELVQMSTHNGHTQLWFGRYTLGKDVKFRRV